MKKYLIFLGHLSLIVTTILSICFYLERTLYVDSGLQLFDIINQGKISIILSRYSMVITQLLPWLVCQVGLPLKYILLSYSLSFILVYYICFLICIYGLKNIPAGLSIALAPLLIRFAFGASICESWMGLVYSALFYAFLNHYVNWKNKGKGKLFLYFLILSFIIALNYFIHPSTLFTLLFAIGFSMIWLKDLRSAHYYFSALIIFVLYLYKFLVPDDNYEGSFFEGIKMADQLLFRFYQLPLCDFFRIFFYSNYIIIPILYFLTGILCWRARKPWIWIFSIIFSFIYLVIASMAFYKGDARFMMESRLIPLIFMATLPFIQLIQQSKRKWMYSAIISGLLIFAYVQLVKSVTNVQTKRIEAYQHYLKKTEAYPDRKFYVYLPADKITPFNSWGSSHETLMLSSLNSKENSCTITFLEPDQQIQDFFHAYPCTFLNVSWRLLLEEKDLNSRYFNLKCTEYRQLEYDNQY